MTTRRTGLFSRHPSEWRAWLRAHHGREAEAWLAHVKKGSGKPGLRYEEGVEEALCFGWIDGLTRSLDADFFLQRDTPGKPGSVWAESNKARVEELDRQRKMTRAGLRPIEAAQDDGRWQDAARRRSPDWIPKALFAALRRTPGALDAYRTLPPSQREMYGHAVETAKRPETREKRIRAAIEAAFHRQHEQAAASWRRGSSRSSSRCPGRDGGRIMDAAQGILRWIGAVAGLGTLCLALLAMLRSLCQPPGRMEGAARRILRLPVLAMATIALLAAAAWAWPPLPVQCPGWARGPALIVGSVLLVGGCALYLWGLRVLGPMFGPSSGLGVSLHAGHRLIETGPYAFVRHPMYLGVLLAAWGSLLLYRTRASLALSIMMFGLLVRARREERVLSEVFGEQWRAYAARVPAWCPRLQASSSTSASL